MDRVVAGLSAQGLAASTRRGYVQAFKAFHAFLVARKASEIEAMFGVRLVNPVDDLDAARHVGADFPSVSPPPGPERMEEFFDFLKERIARARKYTAAGRDYACSGRCSGWAAGGGVRFAGPGRRALRPGAVRQAACPVRQGARTLGPRRGGCRCWTAWT